MDKKKANKNIDSKLFKSSSNTIHSKQTDSDDADDDEAISVDDNEEVHEDNDSTSDILSDENVSDISDDIKDDDEDLSPLNGSKQRQNDEQTIIGITANPSDLSSIVYNLLLRVRRLIKFIRTSSVLDRYIRNQI
ncbi:unnamed protein product [Rotaria socialis]|uniref:Uncharacterized protein n=1 Tax=Rotaria socialis TaxID=392032 RepID=A0A818V5X4_9BILA|nr:unnamed protein product [Rotaria socialis]CAF4674084.1 unnamed protein product [Rotaria socialis]